MGISSACFQGPVFRTIGNPSRPHITFDAEPLLVTTASGPHIVGKSERCIAADVAGDVLARAASERPATVNALVPCM